MPQPRLFDRRQSRARRLDVLVVEDDVLYRTLVEHWLDPESYRVEVAADLDEAARRIDRRSFDLILLDLNLPDASGLDTLDRVQELAGETPVVVLTGEGDDGLGVEALRHGAQDFYAKAGVDPEGLRKDLRFAVERKRVEQARRRAEVLESQNRRLEELDQAKGRFYHAAAEGLAAPLRPILFQLQVVRMEMPEDAGPGLREAVSALEAAAGDLERRLRDLLDVTGIQAGALVARRERLDLVGVVRRVVDAHEEQARKNRLAFDAMLPPHAHVLGDAERLAQVLSHLLDNAIRHTPGGGRVQVHLDVEHGADGDQVVLRVVDDGVGMDPEAAERAFERFLDRGPATEGGRGLGLAFCKAVVEDHGGRVELQSAEDEGTTVAVWLPMLVGRGEHEQATR